MNEFSDPSNLSEGTDGFKDAAEEDTISAGETGEAVAIGDAAQDAGLEEVIVGEIPDASDITRLRWTARCANPAHGLLGTFDCQEQAEQAKEHHLLHPTEA
jgi:hypothetical protein